MRLSAQTLRQTQRGKTKTRNDFDFLNQNQKKQKKKEEKNTLQLCDLLKHNNDLRPKMFSSVGV